MNKKKELAIHEKDTGSSEVQVAQLTDKIENLSNHIKNNKKDKHSSSVNPLVSDSTIKTASFVPATTRSNFEFSNSFFDGFKTYFPSIKPTLDAPTGPMNGIPDIAKAADDATIDNMSASFSLS